MRVHKFRAWDKHEDCYHSWEQLLDMRYNERWFVDNTDKQYINCLFTDESYTLEQYTGLKDKNGKEIFEGDILKTSCNGIDPIDGTKCDKWDHILPNQPVRFDNNYFCYLGLPQMNDPNSILDHRFCEIIGNIHENPELLK